MMKKTRLGMIGLLVLLMICSAATAQDWPQWRGPNRDAKVSGFKAPQTWPSELTQIWKVTVGTGDASPVMVENKIYSFSRIGEEEVITCLHAGNGKLLWQYKYPALAISGPASSAHPGPRSTPAIGEGKVITLGIGGVLSCLDANTGKMVWHNEENTKDLPQFFTGLSPLILKGMCLVHLGGKEKGILAAYDLKTGKVKWQMSGDGPSYASMTIMDLNGKKQIIDLTEKNLTGVDPESGKILWQTPALPANRFYNAASPVVEGQTIFLTGQGQGTAAIKITRQGDQYKAEEIWKNTELGTKWNTPVLKEGFLYGLSDQRKLFCINAKTGETVWVDTKIQNDFGEIVDAGSILVALPQTSNLVIYKPNPKAYQEIATIKVAETPTYTYPILSGNRIFIKDKETLSLLTIH